MNSIFTYLNMSKELFFIGAPLEFKKGVTIYPPTLRDIITTRNYNAFTQILTYSQEEIEDIFVKEKKDLSSFPTPIEFMLSNCYNSKEFEFLCKQAFKFFLKTDVDFLYEQKLIVIGSLQEILKNIQSLDQLITISENEFFSFQNCIRLAINQKPVEAPNPDEHPRIKAMKAKARYRDKIKAKQNAKKGLNLFSIMTSICCMGIGLNPLNIGEMSYVAMNALLDQYQAKEKYEIDIDSLLAGAASKKVKPVYWIKNLEE